MQLEELNAIKAEAKSKLSPIGYKRWEKHLIKCLSTQPMREVRKEIQKKFSEIFMKEIQLTLRNRGEI